MWYDVKIQIYTDIYVYIAIQIQTTFFISLVFQNPPVIPSEEVWKEPLKAEPQEVFGGSNTFSEGIWKTRVLSKKYIPGTQMTLVLPPKEGLFQPKQG